MKTKLIHHVWCVLLAAVVLGGLTANAQLPYNRTFGPDGGVQSDVVHEQVLLGANGYIVGSYGGWDNLNAKIRSIIDECNVSHLLDGDGVRWDICGYWLQIAGPLYGSGVNDVDGLTQVYSGS